MLTTDATNLPRIMRCIGSRLMPRSYPKTASDPTDRDEGNAAHWLAQQVFNGHDINALVNTKAFNNVVITADMADYVAGYLGALDNGTMEVETSFGTDRWRVNARADHISWNADTLIYDQDTHYVISEPGTLTVDDLKYGWRLVEPDGNWTLIAHAIGYCIFNQITPLLIVLRIHQPRPHHRNGKVREWRLTYAQLMDYYRQIDERLSNPTDELRTDINVCAGCHALTNCPAAHAARMNAIDAAGRAFDDAMPNDALANELDTVRTAKATLEAHLTALEELTVHRLRAGQIIDNFAMEPQYANTRWKSGFTAPFLTAATGIDCVKPGLITPAEFKRRGGSEAVYTALTERPLTGTKLVRISADARARKLLGK